MTKWKIYNEDVIEWARHYNKKKFHALLCDPPYHLTSITKRFGKKNSAPAKYGTDGVFSRSSSGFMGQTWDGGDVAFDPDTWAAFGEVLYPGAFGMAFSSSRSWHRLAVAIEDAGFVIHPTIFLWSYGSGFPKATRIDTQIQPKEQQNKKGKFKITGQALGINKGLGKSSGETEFKTEWDILEPTDEVAKRWVGHRYGLQALKPACEPIVVFSKSKGLWYYSIQNDMNEITNLLGDLWTWKATSQEEIGRAAQDVNMILLKVLGLQDQTCLENGLSVETAESSSTKQKELSNIAARKGTNIIAQEYVIGNTGKNFPPENVFNAERNTLPPTLENNGSIVVLGVDMPPKNAPCWRTPFEMGIDIDTLVGMLLSKLERGKLDLSMIWLWNNIWADLCELVNKSTIEMNEKTITALKILNYSFQRLMQISTQSGRNSTKELWLYAQDVARNFIGLLTSLTILEPIVTHAISPIIVFQKPYEGKPIDNIVETGAGALNIDGGRIEAEPELAKNWERNQSQSAKEGRVAMNGGLNTIDLRKYTPSGRWPANFILDEEAAKHLDEQSGISISGKGTPPSVPNNPIKFQASATVNHIGHSDFGGASRFFYTVSSQLDESDPVYYCSKASGKEREAGLEDFERKEVKTHGEMGVDSSGNNHNTTGQVPAKRANIHPTCKPIDLARYLATLLLPPADYAPRRILVPFSGVASEMIGCGLAGWEQIVGVEFDKENGYIDIANARLEHWLNK